MNQQIDNALGGYEVSDALLDTIKELKAENERLRDLIFEAYGNAESVISNMEEMSKRNAGAGFCTKDEELWLKKAKQALKESEES